MYSNNIRLANKEASVIILDSYQQKLKQKLDQLALEIAEFSGKSLTQNILNGFRLRRKIAPKGIYIYGEVGRGKSMLMDMFFDALDSEKKARIHFHSFMSDMHIRMNEWRISSNSASGNSDPIAAIADSYAGKYSVLCLDEMQIADVADCLILRRVLTAMVERKMVVIFTSNKPPELLYQQVFQRDKFLEFVDFLRTGFDIFNLSSPDDYRLKGSVSEEVVYFSDSRDLGYILEQNLKNQEVAKPKEIRVKGHKVKIPLASENCALFGYSNLFELPLSASDYRAIAERYETVIVQNIPQFSYDKSNEAKRFILFVDEMYEHKIKLVISADVDVHNLYLEGSVAFEFQRTISRLIEMQSAEYLGALS